MPDLSLDICVEKLAKQHVNQYLKLDAHQEIKLTQTEINFLLRKSSILSLSNDSNEVSLAYDICSGLIEIYGGGDPVLGPSADLILSRIGNFPGRKLLRSKYLGDEQPYVPFPLAIERLARETENSISNEQILTDFQYKLFAALDVEKSLSVSAPTSAGKSHVLNLDLVRRLQNEKSPCIVYVVPTRALVSEVVGRIRTAIRTTLEEGIVVRTAPFPVHEKNEVKGIVYVLTQERLLRLLTFVPQGVKITTLIVDEAHEIQKGKRGILLQNAVDSAIKKFPEISILFASPLIKNPGYLLQTFGRSRNGRFFTEKNIASFSKCNPGLGSF